MFAEHAREPSPADFVGASTGVGLLILAVDWAAVIALIMLGSWLDARLEDALLIRAAVYVAIVWMIGAFQFAIGETLLHDAAHNQLFKRRSWNNGVAVLVGDPFLIDLRVWRSTHLWHHRDLLGPRDYVPFLYEKSGLLQPGCNVYWLVFLRPIVFPLFSVMYYLFGLTSPRPRMLLLWGAVVAACAYFGATSLLLKYWIVPLVWCFSTFVFWSETADHLYVNGSRSRTGWLANLVFNNNGYHALHHRHAAIPWFRLRAASRALKFQDGEVAHNFSDTLRKMKQGAAGLPGTAPGGVVVAQAARQSLPQALLALRLGRQSGQESE